MQFINFIKMTAIVRLSASGKPSENLENTFTYNVSYAPLISPKGKFGRKPAKMHEEIKDGKP